MVVTPLLSHAADTIVALRTTGEDEQVSWGQCRHGARMQSMLRCRLLTRLAIVGRATELQHLQLILACKPGSTTVLE